jgi:hypothetical protein
MERRKASWAASAAAVTLVAASMAYAATNLLSPVSADHVGELKATVDRPVQYVYDEVPATGPVGEDGATNESNAQVFDQGLVAQPPGPGADSDAESNDAVSTTTTGPAAAPRDSSEGFSPTTTIRSEDSTHVETEDHATDDGHDDSQSPEFQDD